jgi:hypothetical protein
MSDPSAFIAAARATGAAIGAIATMLFEVKT